MGVPMKWIRPKKYFGHNKIYLSWYTTPQKKACKAVYQHIRKSTSQLQLWYVLLVYISQNVFMFSNMNMYLLILHTVSYVRLQHNSSHSHQFPVFVCFCTLLKSNIPRLCVFVVFCGPAAFRTGTYGSVVDDQIVFLSDWNDWNNPATSTGMFVPHC